MGYLVGSVGFLPCRIGAHHGRLQSVGWDQCGHWLTSRPLEVAPVDFSASFIGPVWVS